MNTNHLEHRKKMWILTGVLIGSFMAALDSTIVGTAMPKIIGEMQGMELYAWPFTAYILCMAATIPIFGRLSDILGFKPIYFAGILIFLGGSALCGFAQDMTQLIIFRGIQGLGGGMITANSLAIIGATFAPAERAKYIGLGSSVMVLASIVGPSLGGLIADNLTWRWVFFVNVPVGAVAMLVILFTLPTIKERISRKIDFMGILFFIATVVPLLLAFTWAGSEYEWLSAEILGLFAASLVMLCIFIFVELKAEEPIVPMMFFKNSIFNICSLGMFLSSGITIGTVLLIPLFLQGIIGVTATNSGMVMTPLMLGAAIAAGVGGGIISKTLKYKAIAIIGFFIAGVGMLLLSQMTPATNSGMVTLFMVIVGAGIGLALPVFSLAAQNAVPQSQVGSITGLVQFFRLLGSTLFSAVLGSALTTSISQRLATVDFGALPQQLVSVMQNPQVIASSEALAKMRAALPAEMLPAFEKTLTEVRTASAGAITTIFFIGVGIAAAGFIASWFLKEVALRKELMER
jgi:EmrB/QacA subfamily drug resistance transporter